MIAICIQWYVRYIYAFSIQIENLMQNKTAVSNIHTYKVGHQRVRIFKTFESFSRKSIWLKIFENWRHYSLNFSKKRPQHTLVPAPPTDLTVKGVYVVCSTILSMHIKNIMCMLN